MANSSGWSTKYSICIIVSAFILLSFVPFVNTMSMGMPMHRFCVQDRANKGFIVTKLLPGPECLEMNHVSKSKGTVTNPFSIRDNGYLVINSSLTDQLQDIYIVKTKPLPHCNGLSVSPVSKSNQIHIEIVTVKDSLTFARDRYVGTVSRNAKVGSVVQGLNDLFACVVHDCNNDVTYKLHGDDVALFELRTVDIRGQSIVRIVTKDSLQDTKEETLFLVITGKDLSGLEGHTNVEIHIKPHDSSSSHYTYIAPGTDTTNEDKDTTNSDTKLLFEQHETHSRHKRETELFPDQTFNETKTGYLFSVAPSPPNLDWEYVLLASTVENMFQVGLNDGRVSLAPGKHFDYEDPNARNIKIAVRVSRKSDDIVVKEIEVTIRILDVNDESPVFLNKPFPFLAVAQVQNTPNSLIYALSATDPDEGASLTLEGQLPAELQQYFVVENVASSENSRIKTVHIKATGNQLEANREYTLRIKATDTAAPVGTQEANAEVRVKVGQLPPQFMEQRYDVQVQEDNRVGQVIRSEPITAKSFQGESISYEVLDAQNTPSTFFQINSDRKLYALKQLDYENANHRHFSLTIRATESITNFISSVDLDITVTDLNEDSPTFPVSAYNQDNVPEDTPLGTSLLTVSASDADYNTQLRFSVTDDHFKVEDVIQTSDGATGVIKVNKPLDYDRNTLKMYDFHVIATDNGAVPKSGSTIVTIRVKNVNDESPQFPVNETAGIFMTANIRWNIPTTEAVYFVQASDADAGDVVTYSLVSNQYAGLFRIDQNDGTITLTRPIASDQSQLTTFKYELQVVATDDGSCCQGNTRRSSTGTVTINLLTDNAMNPEFTTCSGYTPSVDENAVDAFVIQVSATDNDYGINGDVTYSIRPSASSDNFRINETTGQLYTAKAIDREGPLGSSIIVNILAKDGGGKDGTCPLFVKINDVNDNAPKFDQQSYSFNIRNDLSIGSSAFKVRATDKDLGQNAMVSYSLLQNEGGYFFIDTSFERTGIVKVNRTLPDDFVETKQINLVVQARDNGTVPLTANTTVSAIIVKRQNLFPPSFSQQSFSVSWSESIARQTALLNISATAGSSTSSQLLIFSIVGGSTMFSIESKGMTGNGQMQYGILRNEQPLDYETARSHEISVRATDPVYGGKNDVTVTIYVEDANDEKPQFLERTAEGNLEISLPEGNYTQVPPPGQRVAEIRVKDNDERADFRRISAFNIISGDGSFTIVQSASDSNVGILYTRSAFDRESVPKDRQLVKTLIIEAQDDAPSSISPPDPNKETVVVRVTITDVNDNPPSFDQASYTRSVKEDEGIGYLLEPPLVANDLDSDAILTYELRAIGAGGGAFRIQRDTGYIEVTSGLDFDRGIKQYNFTVEVFDQVEKGSASVTIYILDVNDNPPEISDYEFNDFFENNTDVVGIIKNINATDIDNGGDNTFYYYLKFTDNITSQYFDINKNTGELRITKPLDRDYPNGKGIFQFTVEAADRPENQDPLYGRATITVRPKDINDNAPFFPQDEAQMSIEENKPDVSRVGEVVVTDYDDGQNAETTLTLISQSPGDNFEYNSGTRSIMTKHSLDREQEDTYYIVMQAVDHGASPNTGTGTLTITVLDENDNPPYFTQSYEFTMSEGVKKNGWVGQIQANDSDIGLNAALTYSLAQGDRTFFQMVTIPPKSGSDLNIGELRIFAEVDYDEIQGLQRSFVLTAYAENPLRPDFKANTTIRVTVLDENDETPKFDVSQKSEQVSEGEDPGYFIANFHATDADVNAPYNLFTYHIQQKSDPLNQFAIDQDGNVTLRNKLDRETKARHEVFILAIDNPNSLPQKTGTATLTVDVGDINDNYPEFAPYSSPSITENQNYPGTTILPFTIIDRDLPVNGPPFTFNLDCTDPQASTQCNKFTVAPASDVGSNNDRGTLSVTGEFDREQESSIRLPVRMCDNLNLCGNRYIDVTVTDVNDNPHGPGYQFILVYNYKGMFGNIDIGEVNVNDPDSINDDKEYRLLTTEAAVFVEVHPNTGIIKLKENVPETIFSFEVRVRGLDGGPSEGLITTSAVTVQVKDIPDEAVYSAGSMRLKGISDEDFLRRKKREGIDTLGDNAYEQSMFEKVQKLLAEKLKTDLDNVNIHSVMYNKTADTTDVRFAAHGSPWYQSSRMDGVVSTNLAEFEQIVGQGAIDMVPVDMCQFEDCEGGCYNNLVVSNTPKVVNTKGASFVGVSTEVVGQCGCKAKMFPTSIECTPGYCLHGGNCVKDQWNVISCECPDGYEGPRCQQLRHTFNGTGYALYKQLEQCDKSRTSIEILTDKADGLIMYNGPTAELGQADPRDFILLELRGGHPRLRINHGTGELMLEIPNSKALNDGAWHRLDIHRDVKKVTLVVDHCIDAVSDRSNCQAIGVTPGENIFINVDQVLQLGGRYSTPSYPAGVTTQRFDGCMKNLIHNAEIYDLSTGDIFPGSADGCNREDDACQTPCLHGACLITGPGGAATCNCEPGWRPAASGTPPPCNTETTVKDFKSTSFMDWRLKDSFMQMLNSRKTAVSFSYRSRDTDGLLFSVVDKDQSSKYIKVKIESGSLQATYNLGDSQTTITLSNVPANDGQWHRVTVERLGKELMLKMDSGEGRYYVEALGPENGQLDLSVKQTEVFSGANLIYSQGTPDIFVGNEQDLINSCINDIRMDDSWFPMTNQEENQSPAATLERDVETVVGCVRDNCPPGRCQSPFVCVQLWNKFSCDCKSFYERDGQNCSLVDYCRPNPCVGTATCDSLNPCVRDSNNRVKNPAKCSSDPDPDEPYFFCNCYGGWYGDLCQCHDNLNSGGDACRKVVPPVPVASADVGMIVGIVLGVLILIILVIVLIYALMHCRKKPEDKEPFDEDPDDDIRENIMYYDEEGAGEEDQTAYDLSRLRKPDTGEHPRTWDAPDIPKSRTKPLGASTDRPDIGDFINNRLDEADDDPNSPPYDTPVAFEFEGGNSSVGSLSSLNTSSSGDQDYDYLNEWGPKFAKLADMYNNYDETE